MMKQPTILESSPFPLKEFETFFPVNGRPNLQGIHSLIAQRFDCNSTGVYLARSIEQILQTKKLDGCQEWGVLWTNILRAFEVGSTYIQGVDIQWLEEQAGQRKDGGWRGHVFVRADLSGESLVFCSTSANVAQYTDSGNGPRFVDGKYVVLFEGSGPEDFGACTQAGIDVLLQPMVQLWARKSPENC